MRAVFLEAPAELLEERRRLGLDRRDEVWDGVVHVVPPASSGHNLLADDLLVAFRRIAGARSLVVIREVGVFEPAAVPASYRVPDLAVAATAQITDRGIEGRAELVIEVLSPNDESREKLPFYARVGVREVWLVDPATHVVDVFALVSGELVPVPAVAGVIRAQLGLELETREGVLRICDGASLHEA
ncbi:MAG: Uma2 family endonuclease [Kofleriaceae bacterium]